MDNLPAQGPPRIVRAGSRTGSGRAGAPPALPAPGAALSAGGLVWSGPSGRSAGVALRGVREGCRPLGHADRKPVTCPCARSLDRHSWTDRASLTAKLTSRDTSWRVDAHMRRCHGADGYACLRPCPPVHQPHPVIRRTRPPGETSEARIAKALAHPLRARILQRLGERVASPGDLAVELGAPLGVVSYHVRMLRDYDCVELVRTEPRRGALQHFYRATARPNLDEDQWRTLPSGLRRELTGETIQDLVTDLAAGGGRRHARGPGRRAHPHAAGARRARLQEAQQAAGQDARAGPGDRGRERRARRRDGLSRPSSASCTSSAR